MDATFSVPARRPRSWPALEHERRERRAPADVERTNAFRTVELVAGQREQVDRQRTNVDPHLSDLRDRLETPAGDSAG